MTEDLRWSRLLHFPGSVGSVPETPGVYAFGKVMTALRLPVAIDWVYIGESRNLKSRLSNHRAIAEENELLAAWLRSNKAGVEVWYAPIELKERLAVERRLIRELQPAFNRIKYKSKEI